MSILSNLQLQGSGISVAREKDRQIRKAIADCRTLFSTFNKKIGLTAAIQSSVQTGKQLPDEQVKKDAMAILEFNRILLPIVQRFSKEVYSVEKLEQTSLALVFSRHTTISSALKGQDQEWFYTFIAKLHADLEQLTGLIVQQNQRARIMRTGKNIQSNKVPFFNQLFGERALILETEREAQRFIQTLSAELAGIAETQKDLTPRLLDISVADQQRFFQFYNKLQHLFPPEELESGNGLAQCLAANYTTDGIGTMMHIAAVEYAGEPIAAVCYNFTVVDGYLDQTARLIRVPENKFSYGVIWWFYVLPLLEQADEKGRQREPKQREYPASIKDQARRMLTAHVEDVLRRDAAMTGTQIRGIFAEVNDPTKMSAQEIRMDSVNPMQRMIFWTRTEHYKSVLKDYFQFLGFDEDQYEKDLARYLKQNKGRGLSQQRAQQDAVKKAALKQARGFATYCHLLYKPVGPAWQHGIPKIDLLMAVYAFTAIACEWPRKLLIQLPGYQAMYKAIAQSEELFGTKSYNEVTPNFQQARKRVAKLRGNPE